MKANQSTNLQQQKYSTLNNVLNNVFNNLFNKVFNNVTMTIDDLAIIMLDFFSLGMLNVGSTCTPNANLEVNEFPRVSTEQKNKRQ